jgi:hypothetical protein
MHKTCGPYAYAEGTCDDTCSNTLIIVQASEQFTNMTKGKPDKWESSSNYLFVCFYSDYYNYDNCSGGKHAWLWGSIEEMKGNLLVKGMTIDINLALCNHDFSTAWQLQELATTKS